MPVFSFGGSEISISPELPAYEATIPRMNRLSILHVFICRLLTWLNDITPSVSLSAWNPIIFRSILTKPS